MSHPSMPQIEAESDQGSNFGDEFSTYTTSLATSVQEFRHEYGRRYHSYRDGQYLMPNDEQEQGRLDIFHAMMLRLLDGKLNLAPLPSNPFRAIDLGTGTGLWAIDFADEHPEADVVGNDLSPIQPSNTPPNLKFVVEDFGEVWAYESESFDYVHARYLAASISDWPKLMRQAYACTKVGGWVEFQDWDTMIESPDGSLTKNNDLWRWHVFCTDRLSLAGLDPSPGPQLEGWMKAAGFVNVTVKRLPIPLGVWPKNPKFKQLGAYNQIQLQEGLEGLTIGCLCKTVASEKAWTIEEAQEITEKVRADLRNPSLHGQYSMYIVCGQRV